MFEYLSFVINSEIEMPAMISVEVELVKEEPRARNRTMTLDYPGFRQLFSFLETSPLLRDSRIHNNVNIFLTATVVRIAWRKGPSSIMVQSLELWLNRLAGRVNTYCTVTIRTRQMPALFCSRITHFKAVRTTSMLSLQTSIMVDHLPWV